MIESEKERDTMNAAVMEQVVDQYRIGSEPYYRPIADEVTLYELSLIHI